MTDIQNPTTWSDYDFLEFECFASKVKREGFLYAAENYGPEFDDPALRAVTDSLDMLRAFYREHRSTVEDWYVAVGGSVACDLHNAHVDESRKREEDACLFGIRCTDDFVITCPSEESREAWVEYLLESKSPGTRVAAVLLTRAAVGGEWVEERAA